MGDGAIVCGTTELGYPRSFASQSEAAGVGDGSADRRSLRPTELGYPRSFASQSEAAGVGDGSADDRGRVPSSAGWPKGVPKHIVRGGRSLRPTELGAEAVEVAFLHSNCVLSFDVEKPRKIVQQFYGQAAEEPQAELCCPTKYDPEEVGHIPQEVLDRFYGCGSPVTSANPQPGEVYVDLGSGAGIDCFIAAKHVGPTGRVIGIDMTDQMLAVARESQRKVADALGYDVVEFRRGFLETIPVEDRSADVVTSNCVVNLSPDKPKVFAELWRILRDHGRAVIADIVSDREVPPRLKVNERLWGECIVGALTEEQFLAMLEQAGFYGLSVMKKTFWKTIEGFNFFSVTVQGFKFEKTQGCTYIGQTAIYRGPFKAVLDEEGHCFPRNVAVSVCTDTASKLSHPPYAGLFTVVEPDGSRRELSLAACCPTNNSSGCC
ncbi:MAG: methyltransferase domain-containing protein [Candidatus Omnitrophica bacterium]|nr:methyltransferase domain-containing protein [Candidatus Omnitrophota bacterium]